MQNFDSVIGAGVVVVVNVVVVFGLVVVDVVVRWQTGLQILQNASSP